MYREPAARPKNRLPLLDRFTKRTPCKVSWSDMPGDDRVRFCCACSKNVHDLGAMSEDAAESFLAHHLDDQEACVRLYRRPDGRILTSDCPRGADKRHVRRVGLAVCVAAGALVAVSAALADLPVARTHHLPGSTSRFEVPRAPVPAPVPRDYDVDPPRPILYDPTPWLPSPLDSLDTRVPHVRIGVIEATSMPPEVIARIVRYSFGQFLRLCYEDALQSQPAVEGRITIHFEVALDGSVWRARDEGSDMRDPGLVACVVRAAANLSFPRPGNHDETVTLSLYFRPP